MKCQQRFVDGLGGVLAHFKFAVKLHLALGRMNVHIYGGGGDFQEKAADRVAAFHQGIMIAFNQGVIDAAIFHRPSVDKNKLSVARGARDPGRTDQTPDAELGTVGG